MMSAFSDAVNRRQRNQGQATPNRENTQRSFSAAVNSKRNELAERTPKQQRVNLSGYTAAQEWGNNVNNILSQYGEFESNWSNDGLAFASYRQQLGELYNQAEQIRAGVAGDREAEDSVSYAQLALRRAIEGSTQTQAIYNQFGSQEEFDNILQWQDDVANMDLGAAWGDLDALKQEKEDFMNMSSEELAAYVEENKENLPGYVEGFWYNPDEIVRDYSTRIAEQTAYLNSVEAARRIPDFELATEDANFARESAYMGTMPQPMGTTKSEARRFYEYINDPSVRAEQDKAWAQANPYGDSPYSSDALNSMTEQEKAVFNYYFNTQGEDAAMAYLDAILSTLRQRKGAEKAAELKDRTLAEFAFAVPVGLDQFSSGLAGLFSNEEQTPSWRQYASAEVREDLGDVRVFQNSNAENSFGQAVYDTTTSLANMAPSIIASTLVGFANPVAGSAVGAGLMGTSAAGNAYQEMLSAGYDMKQARTYGVMVGASEALLSSLLGGISKLGGALPNGITNALLQNIDNAVARVALTIGTNVASEFTEEALQEMLTPYFQNLILNTNHNLNDFTADALYAGMLGAITAGLTESGSTISGAARTNNTGRAFLGSTATLDDLKLLAQLMPDNSEVQDLASRVNEKSNAYTVGRFYEAVENGMPAQYRADVEASRSRVYNELVDAGVTTKDANAIANVAESLMLGKNISKAQETTLNRLREELPGVDEAISNGIHSREMVSAQLRSGVSDSVRGKFNIKRSTETATEATTADNRQSAPTTQTAPQTVSQVDRKATSSTVESIAEEYDVSPSAIYQVAEQSSKQVDEKAFAEGMRSVLAFTQETNLTRDKAAAALQKTGMVSALSPQQIALAVELGWDLRDVVASEKQRAYDMGLAGQDIGDALDSKSLSHLTEEQRREAFNEGAKVAKEAKASGEKVLPKTASMAYHKGSVRFDGDAKAISSKFKLTQKSAYIILDRIAQLTGMDIVLFASKTDEYGNFIGVQGEFAQDNPNEIRIDVNAGLNNVNDMGGLANYVMLRTFTHEFVHSLEVNAKAEYRALKEAVFAEIRKNGKRNVEDLILAQQELGGKNEDGSYNLSYDDASHEVLAQALVDVLPQSTFIETLATQHRNIFDKLYAALKRFMRTIRHRFEQMTSAIPSEASALKRDVDGVMQYAQHIVELFDKAALAAVETVQSRETAEETGGTDESKNPASETAIEGNTVTPPIDPKIVSYFKSKNNVMGKIAVFEYEGRSYVTDGALAIATTPEGVQYARRNLGAGELDVRAAESAFAGADTLITQGPLEGKTENGAVYRFLVGEKKIFVNRRRFSFLDGGLLYANAERLGAIKSVDTNGEVIGYIMPLHMRKEPEDMQPAKTRSFSQKMRRIIDETASRKNENPTEKVRYQARASATDPSKLDPRTVTREDVEKLINEAHSGSYADGTYIPVRISTPGIVRERLGVDDLPMVMPVRKVKQAMKPDNGPVRGVNVRGHGFTASDIAEIMEAIDSPRFVFSQPDGRGAVVVKFPKYSDNTAVLVEFGDPINPAYTNGYEGGEYNVTVTTFNVDNGDAGLLSHASRHGWKVIFDKKKEGDPAKKFPATLPFAIEQDTLNDTISPPDPSVNPSRSQRRENLTDRSVLERVDEIVDAVSDSGTVTGNTHGLGVDEVTSFKDKLTAGEIYLLNIYAERLAKLNDLQEQRREQGRLYRRFMADKNPNNRDKDAAVATKNRMDILDQQIEKAMDSLREAERAKGYKSLLAKSRDLVEQTERGRIKTALQLSREKRERSGQRRQRKESIIRSAEELESLLNKGNKKRNVKKDMQGLAAGVADLYNVLFNEEMNSPKYSKLFNERIVRNGFGVILSTKETTHAEEAKNILAKMERGRTQELENQLAYRMGQLHDALERERERINSINAGDVFQRIADEYKSLQTSGYDYIRGAFSEDAYNHLLQLKDKVGTTAARDMTLSQLIDLDNAYRVVLTTIRNANKLFIDGQKQTVQQAGNRVIVEVGRNARKNKALTNPGKVVATFTWNNEKPIYAFERIGSDTLTNLFWNIRNGEDVWIVDVEEAKAYRQAQAKKYGYDSWDAEKRYEFKSTDGATFSLTLEQLMSLYAYSKREQATEHLLKGGVVLAGAEVIVNGKRLVNDDATAYAIPADTLAKIGESLTADQRGYVDAMQDYLSREMARKGNEISMQLYGIELFGEKNYFPINSSGIYNEKAEQQFRQKENGQISIVNSGFTKSTAPKASNPVRLSGFSDVWASHVNEMSMYHAFVLPLEDFRKVRNFQTTTENGTKGDGVIAAIQNAQGSAAVKYINQLLEDLNGGAISDDRESGLKKLTSKFKKAATMASLSVVVQQISSLPRAWAMIDAKYFAGKVDKQKYSATLAEMRKYAPVMMIKEMGHFDTGMGRSATEYINAREYTGKKRFGAFFKDSGYRDEILGKAPAKVDEIAWMSIWEACKKETHAKHPNMSVTSEAFLKAAGKRFTEVIVKTQVYDSTLTKSANMRSKSALMGMVTSFLAEPTVTANMFFNALRSKDSKAIARTVGALVVSAIANNFLASAVYAMWDDDEDETYWEKYLQAFTTGMADSLNPLTWLPFLRDVWSILQGFDVQRADMNIISAVVDSVKDFVRSSASWSDDMTDEEKKAYWKEFGLSSANILLTVSNAFGIPLKNIYREGAAIFNTFKMANDEVHGNGRKMGEKIWDDIRESTPILGWIPKTESKTDRLYDAIVSGDAGYQERAQLTYSSEKSYENAVRKALRENDPRIEAAARARMSGDLTEYVRLFREILNEGHFEFDTIMAAVNSAENALTPDKESTASESPQTLFTIGNYYTALVSGDETSAQLAYDELYQQKLAEGYLEDEARSSVESSLAAQIGQAYRDDEIGRDQALRLLTENTEGHGEYDIKKWDFQIKYGFSWGSRERAYRTGAINRDQLIEAYMDIEGVSRAEAVDYVDELDFESHEGFDYSDISAEQKAGNINMDEATQMYIQAGYTPEEAEEKAFTIDFIRRNPEAPDITYSAISNYTEHCEPVSISVSTYYDAWKFYNSADSNKDANGDVIEGESKRDKVVDYIDSLPLDADQKHALWLSLGYSAKTSEWR